MTATEFYNIAIVVLGPVVAAVVLIAGGSYIVVRIVFRSRMVDAGSFLIAFASLGVTTGFSTGHSRESAVAAVLPALLTLMSGLLTYAFTKEGLAHLRPLLPYCITVLSLSGLVGLSLGSTLRGHFDSYERSVARAQLHYDKVELESEKALYLARLEIWKQQQLPKTGEQLTEPNKKEPQGTPPNR